MYIYNYITQLFFMNSIHITLGFSFLLLGCNLIFAGFLPLLLHTELKMEINSKYFHFKL